MSFKLVKNPTFRGEVMLTIPASQDRGLIYVEFRAMLPEEFKAWYSQRYQERTRFQRVKLWFSDAVAWLRRKPRKTLKIRDVVMAIVTGWEGVLDDDGQPLEFDSAHLNLLLDTCPLAGLEIIEAYVMSYGKSREKN